MTKKEAIAMAESNWWVGRSTADIVAFQLFEPRLCMPFDLFHEAVTKELGRDVYVHEFATGSIDGLRAEFLKEKPPRSFEDIVALFPADKVVVIVRDEGRDGN